MVSVPQKSKQEAAQRTATALNFEAEIKAKAAVIEKRRELWHGLSQFISRNGGYLVSPPHSAQLTVEIPVGSDLADKLFDLGYDLKPGGTGSHIAGGRFIPVVCYVFKIPTV